MKQIPLTQGKAALVSDRDWSRVRRFKWTAYQSNGGYRIWYALRCVRYGPGSKSKRFIWMHRFILGNPRRVDVDHRSRNGLDNRRSNLRRATRSQNNGNQARCKRNTSGFKGVSRTGAKSMRWRARVMLRKKEFYAGVFGTKREAAAAYARLAKKLFGQFARTN